jgi:hypothetical protein
MLTQVSTTRTRVAVKNDSTALKSEINSGRCVVQFVLQSDFLLQRGQITTIVLRLRILYMLHPACLNGMLLLLMLPSLLLLLLLLLLRRRRRRRRRRRLLILRYPRKLNTTEKQI